MAADRLPAAELIASLLAFSAAPSIAPQDVAADVDGDGVDLGVDSHPAIATFHSATASATTVFTPLIADSADDITFAPVAAGNLIGGLMVDVAVANDNETQARIYTGGKRYLRVEVSDDAAGTPALLASAEIIKTAPLSAAKPAQLEQLLMELDRRAVASRGAAPANQATLAAIIA